MAGEVGKMLLLTDSAGKKYTTFEDMISVSVLNRKLYEAGIDKKFKEVIRTYEEQGEEAKRVVDEALYDEYHMMRGCFHMVRDAWVDEIYN